MKIYKCKNCGKTYKRESYYKKHINSCIKPIENIKKPSQEAIDLLTNDIKLENVDTSIEDKLIGFFENDDISKISLDKYRMKIFRQLYLEYYKKAMLKTCITGIVQAYKALYYTTQKIIKNRNEQNGNL